METEVGIQGSDSRTKIESANEYLESKEVSEIVKSDDREGTPGIADNSIRARQAKQVHEESDTSKDSSSAAADGDTFSVPVDAADVANGSVDKENEGAERGKEAEIKNFPAIEKPEIVKEKASESEKKDGNSDITFDEQADKERSTEKQTTEAEHAKAPTASVEEKLDESAKLMTDTPPVKAKENKMVKSSDEVDTKGNSDQALEVLQASSMHKDHEEHFLKENMPKGETIVNETEAVNTKMAEEKISDDAEADKSNVESSSLSFKEETQTAATEEKKETEDDKVKLDESFDKKREESLEVVDDAKEKVRSQDDALNRSGDPMDLTTSKNPLEEEEPQQGKSGEETEGTRQQAPSEESESHFALPAEIGMGKKLKHDPELVSEGESARESHVESNEDPSDGKNNLTQYKEGEEIKGDAEAKLDAEEEKEHKETETTKTVILYEEAFKEADVADDIEDIKEQIIDEDTGTNETNDEVKGSDQVSVQTMEPGECKEPHSLEIKDLTQGREESFKEDFKENIQDEGGPEKPKSLFDAPTEESQEILKQKGLEAQDSFERSADAADIKLLAETSKGETQIHEQELKMLQEAESEPNQLVKDEDLKFEDSPSEVAVKVLTQDNDCQDIDKPTNERLEEGDEIKTAPELIIPSKDQAAEEIDGTGINKITEQQRDTTGQSLPLEETSIPNDQIEEARPPNEQTKEIKASDEQLNDQENITSTEVGQKQTKESEEEENEMLEVSDAAKWTKVPAFQSHLEEKLDEQVKALSSSLSSEKPLQEIPKKEDEDTKKAERTVAETLEGSGTSETSANVYLKQEDLRHLEVPKQDENISDHTPPGDENLENATFLKETEQTEQETAPSLTLPGVETEKELQSMLENEKEIKHSVSLEETMTMEPGGQTEKASEGDVEVESSEKHSQPSVKPEHTEIEGKHPVTEATKLETVQKQDREEAEGTPAVETKEEISLQQQQSRETERVQAENAAVGQTVLAEELRFPTEHVKEVKIQEEQTTETIACNKGRVQEEEIRDIGDSKEESLADQLLSEESPSEKIQLPSSAFPSEELEHAISSEKQEGKTEESELHEGETKEECRPENMRENLPDQTLPEEKPDGQIQTHSTELSLEGQVQEKQVEVMEAQEDVKKEEVNEPEAQQDADTSSVEKTCPQEQQPRDVETSKRVEVTSDQTIEAQKQAEQPQTASFQVISSTLPSEEREQKSDGVEEDPSVDIKERMNTEEMQGKNPTGPFAFQQKEEAFPTDEKRELEDVIEHGVGYSLTSPPIDTEEKLQNTSENGEEINSAISSNKQIMEPSELIEKAGDVDIELDKKDVEPQAMPDKTESEERHHVVATVVIKEEACLHQEQSQMFQAGNRTEDHPFPIEEAVKEDTEEVKIQEAQPGELKACVEEIPAAHIEQIKGQEQVNSTEVQDNKVKESEPAIDESPDGSSTNTMTETFDDQNLPKEKPEKHIQAQSSGLPLEEQVQDAVVGVRKEQDDETEEAEAETRGACALTTSANTLPQEHPRDFEAHRRESYSSNTLSSWLPSQEPEHKSDTPLPLEEDGKKGDENLKEPSAGERKKETCLSGEKSETEDVIQHESTLEALDESSTKPIIQPMEAPSKDSLPEVQGQSRDPVAVPDNVVEIQAPEMTEVNETLHKKAAGGEMNENEEAPETSDQIFLHEKGEKEIYQENKLTDAATSVQKEIPKEEISGGNDEIPAEKKIEGLILPPDSLPGKGHEVPNEKETVEERFNHMKNTDGAAKEINPEVQKIENMSADGLTKDTEIKKEEQKTAKSQKEGCPTQQSEIAQEVQQLEKTIPVTLSKHIPAQAPMLDNNAKQSQKNDTEAKGLVDINGSCPEGQQTEQVKKETIESYGETAEEPTLRESARNSPSNFLQKVNEDASPEENHEKDEKETKTSEEGTQVEETKATEVEKPETVRIKEAKPEKEKDEEEHVDEHEDKTSLASVVTVETRDTIIRTPHKKSHNILSGVGSKVKHSISKVKKAITGKSSHAKPT